MNVKAMDYRAIHEKNQFFLIVMNFLDILIFVLFLHGYIVIGLFISKTGKRHNSSFRDVLFFRLHFNGTKF